MATDSEALPSESSLLARSLMIDRVGIMFTGKRLMIFPRWLICTALPFALFSVKTTRLATPIPFPI